MGATTSTDRYGWLVFALEIGVALAALIAASAYATEYTRTPFDACRNGVAVPKTSTRPPLRSASAETATTQAVAAPSSTTQPAAGGAGPSGGTTTNPPQAVLNYAHQEGPKGTTLVLPAGSRVDLARPPVVIGEVRRGGPGGAVFPRDRISTSLATQGDFVEMNICADSADAADPGSYQGEIEVFSTNGGSLVLPLSITLADNNLRAVVALSLLTLLVGNLYLYALFRSLQTDDHLDLLRLRDYVYWCGTVKAIVAGAFGLAAAATVFNAQYFASDSFGSSLWQYPTLFVSMLAAFIGAGSAASVPVKA